MTGSREEDRLLEPHGRCGTDEKVPYQYPTGGERDPVVDRRLVGCPVGLVRRLKSPLDLSGPHRKEVTPVSNGSSLSHILVRLFVHFWKGCKSCQIPFRSRRLSEYTRKRG